MVEYIVFDKDCGRILAVANGPSLPDASDFGAVRLGKACPENDYIDTATGDIVRRPDKPGDYYHWDWATLSWVFNAQQAAAIIRVERDRRIAATDWTQLPDIDIVVRSRWASYRQALRDITDQPDFPAAVVWPDVPNM